MQVEGAFARPLWRPDFWGIILLSLPEPFVSNSTLNTPKLMHSHLYKIFGHLRWDSFLDCWLGGIDWPPGLHTEVAIWVPNRDSTAGLCLAHDGLVWLQQHEAIARRYVAVELLELYNESWRTEATPISLEQFMRRTELVRIGFCDDGALLLSYDGRDLFGRVIDADFSPDRAFRGCRLV